MGEWRFPEGQGGFVDLLKGFGRNIEEETLGFISSKQVSLTKQLIIIIMIKQVLLLSVIMAIAYSQVCTAVTNCDSCSGSPPDCTDCKSNFFINTTTTPDSCTACAFKRCWECQANGACLECNYALGYQQDPVEGSCQCNTTAHFVADGLNCRCADGFYKNTTNNCTTCSSYAPQCLTCTATACLSCSGDFVVTQSGTSCEKKCNISGCLTCFNSTVCSTCGPNSALSSSMTACNCNAGFYRNAEVCSACLLNCATCTTGTTCTACSSGFKLNTAGTGCELSGQYMKLALSLVLLVVFSLSM